MGLKKRLFASACVLAACGVLVFTALRNEEIPGVIPENALISKPTITLWYTDEALEDYLSGVAYDYLEEYGIRVVPMLQSGVEYLEAANTASVKEENGPDLMLISNDSLEKACLSGLAAEIADTGNLVNTENFPQTALDAVSYHGKLLGYPLYFETSALVYNKTYLEQAAAEMGKSEEELIPETINDILTFADEYNAPETVEAVFKWDVSDIFYNYFFAGNYIDVGGPCGDDGSRIDIYNLGAVRGLKAYQDLSQFFSIDARDSSYASVVQDFLDGKLVYTVATTDILNRIAACKAEGGFPWEYDVVPLPDSNEEIRSRGLSVTNAVVVNGYSRQKERANAFAAYLADVGAQKLFARTGRAPARLLAASDVKGMEGFAEEYSRSVPMPKLMVTANFWVQMEIAHTKIWSGENVSDILKGLSEQIMTQVTGKEYMEEEYIELPAEGNSEISDGEMD